MTWLKINWFKASIITIAVLFLGNYFYWFQIRPTQIKKMCSFVEVVNNDGYPEVTQQIIDQAELDNAACFRNEAPANVDCWAADRLRKDKPHPGTLPSKYLRKADSAEYKFCLQSHGL